MFEEEQNSSDIAYLVSGDVHITYYMDDGDGHRFNKTHIVYAESESAAEQKFKDFYQSKESSYSTYYSIYNVEVHETIR